MTIKLTPTEAEKFFHNALCNGLHYLSQYGCEIDYSEHDYKKAKERLQKENLKSSICYEDVLLEILIGGKTLTLRDTENGCDDSVITINDVYERLPLTPLRHLTDMMNEIDDADTADVILQTVFYEDVIFG